MAAVKLAILVVVPRVKDANLVIGRISDKVKKEKAIERRHPQLKKKFALQLHRTPTNYEVNERLQFLTLIKKEDLRQIYIVLNFDFRTSG